MRPLLFGTESTNQLRIACDMLRGFGVTRSQRARLSYQATEISSVLQKAETQIPKRGKFPESFRVVALLALVALSIVMLLAGGNFLADNLIKGLRAAEQARTDQYWAEKFALRAQQAQSLAAGWIQLPDGQLVYPRYLGKVPDQAHLPVTGNQL